ncbi:MAG: lysine-sensitive aspartokinase 3 [Vicinamibacteria bacterium]|jgi:aspartate kinase|nr:lysine-sensitive aspartokinase 3 [Vicinamibacteria bacterium]
MIVMKFGGTSVGSAERMISLSKLVKDRLARHPVVVTSAMSKITDQLIKGARYALARNADSDDVLAEIAARHEATIKELFPEGATRKRLLAHVQSILDELRTLYTGVYYLEDLTARSLDAISAMGERISCEIVAAALAQQGVRAEAVDARTILITDETFGRAQPNMVESGNRARLRLKPMVEAGIVPVLGGFIGATQSGVTTTLGRGGSDWSASIIGALLDFEEIQIWTDVDGMMTVDPRMVPSARVIPEVSADEAAELAYFGAKVLHPATIKPAVEKGIPVRILNSLNPSAPGTIITSRDNVGPSGPSAIACKKGITVILVSQPKMLMASGFLSRVFEIFDRHHTAVDLIATSEVSVSLTIDNVEHLPALKADLAKLGDVRILREMSIVTLVGRGFFRHPGLAGRVFRSLTDINVVMISFGASDVNISFVVEEGDVERAVLALHRDFFEGEPS